MKILTGRLIVILTSFLILLSGCRGTAEESESLSARPEPESSIGEAASGEAEPAPEESEKEKKSYLAEEMPELTEEELTMVAQIVPDEVWGYDYDVWGDDYKGQIVPWAEPGSGAAGRTFPLIVSAMLEKPLEEITYGELWRFDNAGEMLDMFLPYVGEGEDDCFPPALRELKSIRKMSVVSENPADWGYLGELHWLEELHIECYDYAQFDTIPEELGNLCNLRKLSFMYGACTEMPDIFDSMPYLEELNLEANDLKRLPPSFYRLEHLRVLNLNENYHFVFDEEVGNLTSLEEIYIIGSYMESLPDSFRNLTNLKVITISTRSDDRKYLEREAKAMVGLED